MNIQEWLYTLPQYLILLPSAASCYLPMKNQLKHPPAKTAALCLAVLVPYTLIAAWAQTAFHLDSNTPLLPFLPVFFLLYRRTVDADLARTLAVYVGVCAVQTFSCHMINVMTAYYDPRAWDTGGSVASSLLQAGLACLMLGLAWLIRRQIQWSIDCLNSLRIWYSTVAISGIFLVLNVALVPDTPEMYYVGQPFYLLPLLEVCILALLVCVYVLFYQAARLVLGQAQLDQRAQLLEMQSHQYQALQEHMNQTARLRHDFRHSVRLLSDMAEQGDLEGVRAYLAQYEGTLTEHAAVNYCTNGTLNALFRYYHEMAVSAGIEAAWRIELPNPLTVSELDLASLFGNILENGIEGCRTLPEGKRYFNLTAELRQGNSLYIVSTNSFDGHVKKGKAGYRSTKRSGTGIGLAAIAAVTEKYGGVLQVSNSDSEFFTDVVIKI